METTTAAVLPDIELDPLALRSAYGRYPSGVVSVCALSGGIPHGLAASSFTSVSLAPPMLSVCVATTSDTWPVLRECSRLGLSIFGAQHATLCRQLAAKGTDRFAGVAWRATGDGAIFLDDAAAWFDCSIADQVVAGDHVVVILAVRALRSFDDVEPLVFHGSRFRQISG